MGRSDNIKASRHVGQALLCIAALATICQAGFFNENNAEKEFNKFTEDKSSIGMPSSIQDDQDLCQRQVDLLAKALKMCYETPPAPTTNGFLKRDYSRGKRSPACMQRCVAGGMLHPAQCHSLC